MKGNYVARVLLALVVLTSLLFGSLVGAAPAAAQQQPEAADWDIVGGHFFTQTGNVSSKTGYAITDDNGVAFWSEFKRLGGVNGVGYPVSGRFNWNGFVCQAMQKVVFQWQPDSQSVSFVNVFDLMHDLGKDSWLEATRQTPKPRAFNDVGLPWDQVVAQHLAVMDDFPAIKQAYMSVGGDPITMNGLPTTDVVDMGNNFIVRAQRVVIQQWKEDVPWAKKGQVTFGLGGSIAKEAGVLPGGAAALNPHIVLSDKSNKFRIFQPTGWVAGKAEDNAIGLINVAGVVGGSDASILIVETEPNEVNLTFDTFKTMVTSDAYAKSMAQKGLQVVSVKETVMDGVPAMRTIIRGAVNDQTLWAGQIATVKGNQLIDVTLSSMGNAFAADESALDFVAGSYLTLR
ncbi:MAG: hypothetical protein ACYC4L_21500 [Chloroflexota bacterium]